MTRIGYRRSLTAVALLVLLGGCAMNGVAPEMSRYDLGPLPRPGAAAPGFDLRSIEVVAPSWLDGQMIQYRLLYDSPAQRMHYAESRWVAAPAELLEGVLRRALASSATVALSGGCRLHVELDEFSHHFDAPGASHGRIEVRAALLAPRNDTLLARRSFPISRAARRHDARGAVDALAEGVEQLTRELHDWLAGLDHKGPQGLNIARSCYGR